ncbi:MAG TPA: PLP-dependent aminotransferase family protein [Gaiellaceae bacterium]|jgi:DNA-binding transcriptional MocR family regulator|nr:PLP-dependent aminotransferase family protein [Gaiellaceae bacterium]
MEGSAFRGEGLDPALLPLEELADCAATALAADGKRILSYGSGAGYTPLRELIAEWFRVHPRRVVLTNGSLQGLGLLARQLAGSRPVVAEYPINDRAEKVLLDAGAMLLSVQVGPEGMQTDELKQMLTEYRRPAFVYTIPTFHNPSGTTMTGPRRITLTELVRAQNLLQAEHLELVEDDSYGLTRFEGERLPTLFDCTRGASVYASSFSATIAPGLRVGWLVLPDALAPRFVDRATDTYITPALLGQATVFEFLRRGSLEAHLERLREGLRLRRDALLDSVAVHFPDGSLTRPEGGVCAWLELPPGTDSRPFVEGAATGLAAAGTAFASTANGLRLSFGSAPPDELESAVERLAEVRAQLSRSRAQLSS